MITRAISRGIGRIGLALLGLALLGLAGCAPEAEDTAGCAHDPPLTWENFGHAIVTRHCLGCHSALLPEERREGAPAGVDFDTYGDVLAWAERIEARSTGEGASMPPGGGPTAPERELLAEWLSCGVAADRARLEAE